MTSWSVSSRNSSSRLKVPGSSVLNANSTISLTEKMLILCELLAQKTNFQYFSNTSALTLAIISRSPGLMNW